MLELAEVSKIYRIREGGLLSAKSRTVTAVDGVNLLVNDHETTALLGPNGAGKSTLCKMAAGMIKPTSGKVYLDGVEVTKNIASVSKKIGVVLGPSLVYYRMRGRQYLRFFARVYQVKECESRIEQLSEELGIRDVLDEYIEEYSTGMKMKISLARALLHEPPFLVLDEFTSGLDPVAALKIRELVKSSRKTILLTTHNPHEAEVMADKVAFMSKGKLVAHGSPTDLIHWASDRVRVVVTAGDPQGVAATLRGLAVASDSGTTAESLRFSVKESEVPSLLREISKHDLRSINIERPSLEDAYAKFAGQPLRQAPGDEESIT